MSCFEAHLTFLAVTFTIINLLRKHHGRDFRDWMLSSLEVSPSISSTLLRVSLFFRWCSSPKSRNSTSRIVLV
uniref:Uncharacterized protein n=1 Tax=Anguilla anguilla TaxID=7936 RepID=A0A0E9WKY3_ANGAN